VKTSAAGRSGPKNRERPRWPVTQALVPRHVLYRRFATQTVVFNLHTGRYHGLDETGGRMLELIAATPTLARAAAAFAEESGRPRSQVERELLAFCEKLAERGLIDLRAEPAGRAAG
jgi:Coenzyme PQQ synthesis protein D (PqqD)